MQSNKTIKLTTLVTALLLMFAGISFAVNIKIIKKRMQNRLPAILELKKKGIVGENNRGYLGFVGSQKVQAKLIKEENQDRRALYQYVANKIKKQLNQVEANRAFQRHQKAAKGTYIMNPKGRWVKK